MRLRVRGMQGHFDAAIRQKQALEDDAANTSRRMSAANALLGALAGEEGRWTGLSKDFDDQIQRLTGAPPRAPRALPAQCLHEECDKECFWSPAGSHKQRDIQNRVSAFHGCQAFTCLSRDIATACTASHLPRRAAAGDCAVASSFVSYLGPFNREFRELLLARDFAGACTRMRIPATPDLKVSAFLADEAEIGECIIQVPLISSNPFCPDEIMEKRFSQDTEIGLVLHVLMIFLKQ